MKFQTIDLFLAAPAVLPLETLVQRALAAITILLERGTPLVVAFSGGRDSGVVASLVLIAAREFKAATGRTPFVVVTTSDTLVESPEIAQHYYRELDKMERFGHQHGLNVHTNVVTPNLTATFQVKILTGTALPSFAGNQTDCTEDLKIAGQRRYRRELFRRLAGEQLPEPVTCLGTRYSESARREANMRLRGERPDAPVKNADGDWILSPIAHWSLDDLTEYIGMCTSGMIDTYTDFKETDRIYAHSAGTNCSVIADVIEEGGAKRKKGGCGARHGCWTCQQAEDKSLENMIAFDPRYEYARGLNKLNKFIRNTRYHWKLRHWVGRTIRGGYVCYQPDTYHPLMLNYLTRLMLQLDYDEMVRASKAGEERRFTIMPVEIMIAVDALQSLNGVARPFSVWAAYRDIFKRGIRFDIPEVPYEPPTPLPDARFLYVGEDWAETTDRHWSGRRDPYWEALTEDSPCAPRLAPLKDGSMAWDVQTEKTFTIDGESAMMISLFEVDHLCAMYDNGFTASGVTAAYKWYLRFGCMNLSHSMRESHDTILRRTEFKGQMGIGLDYDPDEIRRKTVQYADMPQVAREAWAHKRTTDSAQSLFAF